MPVIQIEDPFDLEKIADSGQCFRVNRDENLIYRFIYRDQILYIKKINENKYWISCDLMEWQNFWFYYFDFDTSYKDICSRYFNIHKTINKAINVSKGIRILRQDPWETLISFIISQNKNIPAIKNSIDLMTKNFGEKITTAYGSLYLFPSPHQLLNAGDIGLRQARLGYRSPYILDAAEKVESGKLSLEQLNTLPDSKLLEKLMAVKGVGPKVANCVSLFGYHRTNSVPVDVWIKKTIQEDFNGISPFDDFKDSAGIIQQFLFYMKRKENK